MDDLNGSVCLSQYLVKITYSNKPECWDLQARANSVDLDQTPQNAESDQGLRSLPLIQPSTGRKMDFV